MKIIDYGVTIVAGVVILRQKYPVWFFPVENFAEMSLVLLAEQLK
jgi:hypothetical protein